MDAFTDAQILEFKEAFRLFDKDGSGKIDPQELLLVMKSLGQAPTEAEVADMIHDVDANGDGEIDFNEFVTMMSKKLNEASGADHEDDEMRAAFRVFDKDGDGFIDASELKLVMQQLGEPLTDQQLSDMLREADSNNDGHIDFSEFCKLMGGK